jgi:hypothetical protein
VARRTFRKKYSWKVLKAEDGQIDTDQESMTEKGNQRELLWFQAGERKRKLSIIIQ